MPLLINLYKKNFLVRYDFDIAIPYYSTSDFKGLKEEENTFINDNNVEIHYFSYQYQKLKHSKVILFLPGIGPGHKAYMKEINELTKAGYKVITLDYEGCGYSKGNRFPSINQPTIDVLGLLKVLNLKEEIVIVGHSLGAYTALNVINKVNKINRAIIISGFLNVKYGMMKFVKSHLIASKISKYEHHLHPEFDAINNLKYLKQTSDHILFIHSQDDQKASYKLIINKVEALNNPHLSFIKTNDKHHNPNYTVEAVNYKDKVIDKYLYLLKKGKLNSVNQKKAYFNDVNIDKMTDQDPIIIKKILNFIG